MRHAPAILATAFLFWVAVSFARGESLNGGHFGLLLLWGFAYWNDYERKAAHARASTNAD